MEEENNAQKTPKRFIDQKVLANMEPGEVGYINRFLSFRLDENDNLWIPKNLNYDTEPETDDEKHKEESEHKIAFFSTDNNIKIERTATGFKLYLYRYFELLWEKHLSCSSLSDCNSNIKKRCGCKKAIRHNLINKTGFDSDEKKRQFILITEFDEPGKNINDPKFLQSLTPEIITGLKTSELEKILRNSLDDELYEVAKIVRIELDKRKG